MLDDASILLMAEEEELEEDLELRYRRALVFAAFVGHGILESRRIRRERYQSAAHYLTRPSLLPNPRAHTPWQALYALQDDKAFITTLGFNVQTFKLILSSAFSAGWDMVVIPRSDIASTAIPRSHRRSLDAAGALGLALHYLTSTVPPKALSLIFALVPATVQRYLQFSLSLLLSTLRTMPKAQIVWPKDEEFETYNDMIVERHPLLTGAFATMDGLNLHVETSGDEEVENATYNGWLHEHFISNVFAFAPTGILVFYLRKFTLIDFTGEIIACKVNAPGSWHDSRVALPIYEKLLSATLEGYYIVADAAFPRGMQSIEGRIKAPITSGTRLPTDEREVAQLLAFNRQLLSYRQTAEWGNRALQGAFGRLRLPLPIRDHAARGDLLENCVRLHNLRTRLVGLNEIRSVYMPLWTLSPEEAMWDRFETKFFSTPHAHVARFETVAI
jgi:DDE superfamily endonuclease